MRCSKKQERIAGSEQEIIKKEKWQQIERNRREEIFAIQQKEKKIRGDDPSNGLANTEVDLLDCRFRSTGGELGAVVPVL